MVSRSPSIPLDECSGCFGEGLVPVTVLFDGGFGGCSGMNDRSPALRDLGGPDALRNSNVKGICSQATPSLVQRLQGFRSSHYRAVSRDIGSQRLELQFITFFRLCLHVLHPVRERQMLVFFGRGGAGLYMLRCRSRIVTSESDLQVAPGKSRQFGQARDRPPVLRSTPYKKVKIGLKC